MRSTESAWDSWMNGWTMGTTTMIPKGKIPNSGFSALGLNPADQVDFVGSGWRLPPGGGRTADADAGLEVGIIPPSGLPLRLSGERSEPVGARSAPLTPPAGALLIKVAGGSRGAEPPALGNNASSVSRRERRRRNRAMEADRQRLTLHNLSQRVAPPNSSWAKCGKVPRGKPAIIRDIDAALRSQYAPIAVVGVVG